MSRKILGNLKIDNITELPNGDMIISFSNISQDLKNTIKRYYNKSRFSKSLFQKFMIECLYEAIQ